ncbi:DNA translocase FtsK [Mesobacillus thioparans]|uniref:DNA translocase FtsK n=1 Tax=Mesobacillus thioparans TaxID=370439 RepID=UPI0039EFAA22
MSWIKKIFTMFQNDDDEFEDIEREQPVQKLTKQERSEKKDLEAKVLYQYPKGQFRFPLIPDGQPGNENPRKERKERVSPAEEIKPFINEKGSISFKGDSITQMDSNPKPRRKAVVNTKDKDRTARAGKMKEPVKPVRHEEPASKFRYEPRKDSGPKFTQPFKPTEIPSPIYAFNRPPRKDQNQKSLEDVEFELTGFEKPQENKGTRPVRRDIDLIHKEPVQGERPEQLEKQNEIVKQQPVQNGMQNEIVQQQSIQNPMQNEIVQQQPVHIGMQNEIAQQQPVHVEMQNEIAQQQSTQIEVQKESLPEQPDLEQDRYIEDDLAETQDLEAAEIEDEIEQFNLEAEALDVILHGEVNDNQVSGNGLVYGDKLEEDVKSQAESVEIDEITEVLIPRQSEPKLAEFEEDTDVFVPRQNEPESADVREDAEIFVPQAEAGKVQEPIEMGAPSMEDAVEMEAHPTIAEDDSQPIAAEETVSYTEIVQPTEAEDLHLPENSFEESDTDQGVEKEEGKPAEPKRQLPFNVLMLKQDKRKWEARNMSKYPSFMTDGRRADGQQQPSEGMKETHERTVTEDSSSAVTDSPNIVMPANPPAEANTDVQSLEREAQPAAQEKLNGEPVADVEKVQPISQPAEELAPSPVMGNEQEGSKKDDSSEIHPAAVYDFPPLDLLNPPVFKAPDPEWLAEQEHMLNETLRNFNVGARVVNVTQGPSVTRFEVQPEPGVKVNKITNLSDDIKLSLAAKDIRIEAPIPGKHTIGIEVPNHSSRPVLLSEILQSAGFMDIESPLSVALGLDIAGNPIVTDLKKMPHGLIAGATGSGKSVCINTMLVSLLYKAHPDEVKLLLIDPKMVELAPYNRIPHLVSPVITDVKAATASLKWAVEEMERRYELFAHTGVRDISRFNELAEKHRRFSDKLPYIVIVIDELADLMMMAPGDVEEAICRIAQKARACGIHLIIATQRPSVDVITGLIKANVPTRIAFSVSSQVDSRTIIDISGAEKLLGRGDMLFLENGSSKPFRLQGTFVTDNEIDDIVAFVREQRDPQYLFEQEELLKKAQVTEDEDELFYEACEFVIDQGGASTSSVQRRFKIGYNRAARLIEMMEQQGFISEGKGSKPRDVLITAADLESLQETSTFN